MGDRSDEDTRVLRRVEALRAECPSDVDDSRVYSGMQGHSEEQAGEGYEPHARFCVAVGVACVAEGEGGRGRG